MAGFRWNTHALAIARSVGGDFDFNADRPTGTHFNVDANAPPLTNRNAPSLFVDLDNRIPVLTNWCRYLKSEFVQAWKKGLGFTH